MTTTLSSFPFEVGKTYLIRGYPLYYIGEVVRWTDKFVTLRNAAWVRDTGSFTDVWRSNEYLDVCRYPVDLDVHVAMDRISDFAEYEHWAEPDDSDT